MKPESLGLLKDVSLKMGVELDEKQIAQLVLFIKLLQKWSRKINLTAIREEKDIVVKLILDSFLLHGSVQDSWFVLDVGSGNGCPGIPLKIVRPSIRLLLLESRGKKATFLRTAIREIGLADCQAIQQRAEDPMFRGVLRGQLDAVTARAVGKTSGLVKTAMPYLRRPSGRLLLMKGSGVEDELEKAGPAIRKAGARVLSVEEKTIPGTDWKTRLVTIAWSEKLSIV